MNTRATTGAHMGSKYHAQAHHRRSANCPDSSFGQTCRRGQRGNCPTHSSSAFISRFELMHAYRGQLSHCLRSPSLLEAVGIAALRVPPRPSFSLRVRLPGAGLRHCKAKKLRPNKRATHPHPTAELCAKIAKSSHAIAHHQEWGRVYGTRLGWSQRLKRSG